MESKKNNHGWNHGCKGSIHRYHMLVIKEIVIITRSFHDRIYRVHGHEHKVQGRLPLLQCITFHSLLTFDEVAVLKFYLVKHIRVWLVKTSELPHSKEGIGSTHQGILRTYTTNFNSKYHQLESRAWLAKQMIQFTEGTMYQGKNSQGDWIWRTLSDSNPTMDWAIHNGVEVSIGIPERMHGHHIIEHRNNLMLR